MGSNRRIGDIYFITFRWSFNRAIAKLLFKFDLADRWDLLCKQIVGKYLLTTLSLFLLISLFGCTRVVSLPVRTVVDWTDENTLSTESVYDLSGNTSE